MDIASGLGYPYEGCVEGMGQGLIQWYRPYGDVVNSFVGAERCALKCLGGGYKYWGLECPRHDIHCQCGQDGMLNQATFLDDEKCRTENIEKPAAHCFGPFTSSMDEVEYLHGAAYISSVYLTKKSGR